MTTTPAPAPWPLETPPAPQMRLVLGTHGLRLWSAECHIDKFDGNLVLICGDAVTRENLARQRRVSFTILDGRKTVSGSGIARSIESHDGLIIVHVEPYRVSDGETTWEVRLNGWVKADITPAVTKNVRFWYTAFRMITAPLSVLPVLLGAGAALAQGRFSVLTFLLALIGTLAAHAGANAIADYFDFRKGVDLSRALSSHLGALAQEKVTPDKILLAAFACFTVTVLSGVGLVLLVGWQTLLFGAAGLLGAFYYTGWPVSYKYRGLGEIMLGLLLGPLIVMGSYYTQAQGWDWAVFVISMGLAAIVSSTSLVNNLRDLPDDRAAGIHTLPMTLGIRATKALYYTLIIAPYWFVAAAIIIEPVFWPMALVLVSVPRAVSAIRALHATANDEADIRQKALTTPYPLFSIKLHTTFGAMAVAGTIVAAIMRLVL